METLLKNFEKFLNENAEKKVPYWANEENVKKSLQNTTNQNGEIRVFLPQTVRVAWFNACNPNAKVKVTLKKYEEGTAWSEAHITTIDGAEANSLASCSIDEQSGFYDAVEGSQIRAVAQCAKFLGYFLPEEISGALIPSTQKAITPPEEKSKLDEMLSEFDEIDEPLSDEVMDEPQEKATQKALLEKEEHVSNRESLKASKAILGSTRKASEISEEKKNRLEQIFQEAVSSYGSQQLLERCRDTTIKDGKHNGKTLGAVLVEDTSYLLWLVSKKASTDLGKRAYMLLRMNNKI